MGNAMSNRSSFHGTDQFEPGLLLTGKKPSNQEMIV